MLVNIKTTYDEFSNLILAKENNFHKVYYYCPNCNLEIGKELKSNKKHSVIKTLLKDNRFPYYCPECGVKLDYITK